MFRAPPLLMLSLLFLSGCIDPAVEEPNDALDTPVEPDAAPEPTTVSADKETIVALAKLNPLLPATRADGVNNNCVYIVGLQEGNATQTRATFTRGTGLPVIQGEWSLSAKLHPGRSEWTETVSGTLPLHLELNITDVPLDPAEDARYIMYTASLTGSQPNAMVDAHGTLHIEVDAYTPDEIDIRSKNQTSCS